MKRSTLFFNENPMPLVYTTGTLAAKELRLRAALSEVDEVHVIAPPGKSIQTADISRGLLEKKIIVHRTIPWPYYGGGILHFFYGIFYIFKYHPIVLEAESAIISGPAVVILGKLFGIPTIVELRASYEELIKVHAKIMPYFLKKFLLRVVTQFSYSWATGLIANSKTYQTYLKKRGFASIEINPGLQNVPVTTPYLYSKRKKLIGYIGRLVEEKGVDDLLMAVNSIKSSLVKNGWKVLIAGDGVRRHQLERLAKDLGLSELVQFLGTQYNYAFLEQLKIAVNPCFVKHPLEMVNVEAASLGTPMVCYGEDSIPETVLHERTGYVLPYRDVKALQRAIKLLMDKPIVALKLSKNGPAFAHQNYSFASQVLQLHSLYRNIGAL